MLRSAPADLGRVRPECDVLATRARFQRGTRLLRVAIGAVRARALARRAASAPLRRNGSANAQRRSWRALCKGCVRPPRAARQHIVQLPLTPIEDSEGTRAVASNSPSDPSCLQVTLEDGQCLEIPRALVHAQSDGTYRFEQPLRDRLKPAVEAPLVLPITVEEVQVGTRLVERERLRVSTTVTTREESVEVPLVYEGLVVERVPVGRVVDAPSQPRHEGHTLVVPVYEEQLVLQKRLVLKEEVRITRTRQEQVHKEQVQLRQEHVSVEKLPPDGSDEPSEA